MIDDHALGVLAAWLWAGVVALIVDASTIVVAFAVHSALVPDMIRKSAFDPTTIPKFKFPKVTCNKEVSR